MFSAADIFGDTELYSYDGHKVQLLANINQNVQDYMPQSSYPSNFTVFGNVLVFSADDGVHGIELWSYDGHQVRFLADINQKTENGVKQSSSPSNFKVFGNELVFRADDGETGFELWSYDGHAVHRLADINPNVKKVCTVDRSGTQVCTSIPQSSNPGSLTVFREQLIFQATDGTTGKEMWRYDGFEVRQVANINQQKINGVDQDPGASGFVVFGNELVFAASDGISGYELWSYDGHTIHQIADFHVGPYGSFGVSGFIGRPFDNKLLFAAIDGDTGEELWSYDGREIRLVADINPGPNSSTPGGLTMFSGELVFSAGDTRTLDRELWAYDGSEVRKLADINPNGSSIPMRLTVFGNELAFIANDGTSGWELWSYDGHLVSQVADINPFPNGSSNPTDLMVFGNELIFSADDGTTGVELWRLSHVGGKK